MTIKVRHSQVSQVIVHNIDPICSYVMNYYTGFRHISNLVVLPLQRNVRHPPSAQNHCSCQIPWLKTMLKIVKTNVENSAKK